MSAKKLNKSLKIPTNKSENKEELSHIGKELLNHCNTRQPVFLYGEYKKRKDLFRDVHSAIDNNNIDAGREYVDDGGNPTTREKLKDEFKRIYKSKSSKKKNKLDIPLSPMSYDLKEQGFLDRHFLSTPRTGNYVDCGAMSAKEVYIELVIDAGIISEAKIDEASKMLLDKYMNMDIARMNEGELRSIRDGNSLSSLYAMFNGKTIEAKPVYKGYLFQCKGNLFIDNLPKPTSSEDKKYYCQLAEIIIDRALGYESTAFNWLAAYTHDDPKDFDKYFVERFEPIPLDRKEVVVESVKERIKTEDRQQEGRIGQTNAKKNLSKALEYIRCDDDDEKFYAKAKGKTNEYGLNLSGQPLDILHCFFNKHDSGKKKVSVPIDTVLYEAKIKEHKKKDNISKDKKDHLSSKITPIKDELEIAGFDRDRIKIDGEDCELSIEFLYDI